MSKHIAWNKGLLAPWAKNLPQKFQKGHAPWNKGLKGYNSRENSPTWKGGMIEFECQYCKRIFKDYPSNNRKYCSAKCSSDSSIGRLSPKKGIPWLEFRGENHPRYNGKGRHDLDRKRVEVKEWRMKIFNRDSFICRCCGDKEKIQAHHIKKWSDYPKIKYKVNNGITLCLKCHKLTLGIEKQCEKYFEELLQKAVNSGEILTGKAEDNLEPSLDSNIFEGATHRTEVLMG